MFPRLLLSSALVSAGGPRNEDDEDRHKSEQQEEKGWLVKKRTRKYANVRVNYIREIHKKSGKNAKKRKKRNLIES